ncbi:hypothetical protein E4P82_15645 [Candidatus Competibacter phosphatis]|uniref:Tetratricopeptide repeat protein n=1 Tax=Candidatus Competibacter phosphatis TaxID=221280 RepID=A0ABX1TM66_9GAMM|nr:hypothetical protein [Candidatus Competibacter phosphatis]NMQ20500.1 hypothetical protein [Candidatus Competibacter phosphatis]
MKLAIPTADPHFPDDPPTSDDGPDSETIGAVLLSGFLRWLRHFAIYMGAVLAACAIGFFFLWQIPIVHELPQLLNNGEGVSSLLAAATPSSRPPTRPRDTPSQPTAAPRRAHGFVARFRHESRRRPPTYPPTTPDPQPDAPDSPTASTDTPATPPVEEIAPPPTPQAEIEQLLAEAQQQMDSRRITAPASGNALNTYRHVLELQPENPVALAGIQRIAAYYQNAAEQSLRQGQPDESLAYLGRGLRAAPNDQALLNLRREAQLAKQREQEAQKEQALLEEARRQQQAEQQQREELQRREMETQQPWWQQPPNYQNSSGFNQR